MSVANKNYDHGKVNGVLYSENSANNNNNLLQLGCYPVAVVILHVNKT